MINKKELEQIPLEEIEKIRKQCLGEYYLEPTSTESISIPPIHMKNNNIKYHKKVSIKEGKRYVVESSKGEPLLKRLRKLNKRI